MSRPARLAAFALVLALLFGAGTLAGAVAGPEPTTAADPHAPAPAVHAGTRPAARGHRGEEEAHPVRGLAVAEDGLRLVLADPELRRGRPKRLAFRIVGEDGRIVRDFDVAHERRMHLILARRDLTGFQHLHPRQREDGGWETRVRVDQAGSYRVFADFTRDGEAVTLAADVRVDGAADLRPLPAARQAAVGGGYDVRLEDGGARPGKEAALRFAISRDGISIHPQPYLGARGHLVALREGDLAFLHVHPTQHGHGDDAPSTGGHDDAIGFAATFPTEGRYRLFLQFRHAGRVHTAAFTQEVA